MSRRSQQVLLSFSKEILDLTDDADDNRIGMILFFILRIARLTYTPRD